MISLRKTATELERLEELHRAAVNCYSQALRSTEQNAIELDTAQAAHFRAQLQALRDQLRADAGPGEMEGVQSSFDTELKDYRDKTRDQIQRLRQEVKAAAAALETFAGSINESESNLESGLKRELSSLKQSALSNDVQEIRGAIQASTSKIAASVEQMRSSNQLAIAQLKDEIRLLHQEVQAARRSPAPDPGSESRRQMNGRMEEFVKKNASFSVLLVVVHNLDGLRSWYSAGVRCQCSAWFPDLASKTCLVPSPALVGRCAKDQFAAILSTAPGNAIQMSNEVVGRLSEPFLEQDKGGSHSVVFNARAGVIEFTSGSDLAKFQSRLKQLADTLLA